MNSFDNDEQKYEFVVERIYLKPNAPKSDRVNDALKATGYQNDGVSQSDVDNIVNTISNNITNIINDKDTDNLDLSSIDQDNVLQVISRYNLPNRSLIDGALSALKTVKDPASAVNNIRSMVDKLKNRAESAANALGGESCKAIRDEVKTLDSAMSALETASNPKTASTSALKDAFNKVYAMARIAEIRDIERTLKNNYGDIDSKLFNENGHFLEETMKDLKDEKLEKVSKEVVAMVKPEAGFSVKRNDNNDGSNENVVITPTTTDKLEEAEILLTVGTAKIGDVEYKIYDELTEPKRLLGLYDGKLYEIDINCEGKYVLKEGVEPISLGDFAAAARKLKACDAKIAELVNNNGYAKEHNGDKKDVQLSSNVKKPYVILSKEGKYYIVDDNNNLREVTYNNATNVYELQREIKVEDPTAQTVAAPETEGAKDKVQLSKVEYTYTDGSGKLLKKEVNPDERQYIKNVGGKIKQGTMCRYRADFEKGIKTFINDYIKYEDNNESGYTEEEFQRAKDNLLSYYVAAFKAIEDTDWTKHSGEESIPYGVSAVGVSFHYDEIMEDGTIRQSEEQAAKSAVDKYDADFGHTHGKELDEKVSETGLYITVGTSWGRYSFSFSIKPSEILEKFKSFLP